MPSVYAVLSTYPAFGTASIISTVPDVLYFVLPRKQNSSLLLSRGRVLPTGLDQERGSRDLFPKEIFPHSFPPISIQVLTASSWAFWGIFGVNWFVNPGLSFSFLGSVVSYHSSDCFLDSEMCYLFFHSLQKVLFSQCGSSQIWGGSEIRWVCSAHHLNPEVLWNFFQLASVMLFSWVTS